MSRRRVDDATVRHGRLAQQASNISGGKRALQSGNIIEFNDLRCDCRIYRRTNIPAPGVGPAAAVERDKGLVHGTVVAPVIDQNLLPPANLPPPPTSNTLPPAPPNHTLPVRPPHPPPP